MGLNMLHTKMPSLARNLDRALNVIARYIRFNHCLFAALFVLSAASFWLSYELRFDFQVPEEWADQQLFLVPYVAALKLFLFYLVRGHATDWRYIGLRDIPVLFLHCTLAAAIILLASHLGTMFKVPKGVIIIDFFLSMVLIGGARVGLRVMREKALVIMGAGSPFRERRAVVIGAGDAGEMIVREIMRNPASGLRVLALFDDDATKRGLRIHGVKVVGGVEVVPAFVSANDVQTAIIAIPSADKGQMKRIYNITKDLDITVKTLPSLHEMIDGSSTLTQLRQLDITDLLGREEVRIDSGQVENLIRGKVVLVTGAGGSIGSELCRQVLKRKPRTLVMADRSESNLFHVHRRLHVPAGLERDIKIEPVLCDVCDPEQVDFEFRRFRPDLVFHAAAYKHVWMQELHPVECLRNNVGGTRTVVQAAHRWGVDRFLLISTDKAVNPSSVMGATKRACEIYCSAFGVLSPTKFLSVRFGNVLASDGSVVPLFMEQIARGGPVTVTDPDMRRYFMTISEAATLVLQATALGDSGRIMVLDMGEPIRIVDMAQQLIQLMGRHPDEVPIQFVGARPGEKLFEELSAEGETYLQTAHSKIKIFHSNGHHSAEVIDKIDRLVDSVRWDSDPADARRILREIVPEYRSSSPA